VFATDDSGKAYNIEIQRAKHGAGRKRARYNQSIMDVHELSSGEDTDQLPESYIIFFAETDVIGAGLPIYHIERIITETQELFGDGEHIIYVNGEYKDDSTPLGQLIADFHQTDPDKIQSEHLADRMRYLKYTEQGVSQMCQIVEDIVLQERAEAESVITKIVKAYHSGKTIDEAAEEAGCSVEKVTSVLKQTGLIPS
jgi:hypothetical protein